MRKLFVISLFIFALSNTFAQQQKIDSLRQEIYNAHTPEDSLKIYKSLLKLIHKYEPSGKNFSEYKKALKLSDKLHDFKFKSVIYRYLSTESKNIGNWENFYKYINNAIIIDSRYQNEEGRLLDLNILGASYFNLGKYKQSIQILEYALSKKLTKDYPILSTIHTNLGLSYGYYTHNSEQAIKEYLKAIDIANKFKDDYGKYLALYQIGILYINIGNYNKANKYLIKVINDSMYHKVNQLITASYDGLLYSYDAIKAYDSAMIYGKKALKNYKLNNNIQRQLSTYNFLFQTYNNLKLYDSVIQNVNAAKKLFTKTRFKDLIYQIKVNIGFAYLKKHNLKNAEKELYSSLNYFLKNKNKKTRLNKQRLFLALSEINEKKKKFKEALMYHKQFADLMEKDFKEKLKTKAAEIETKYQTAKKEKENALLKKQKAEQELEIAKRKRQNLIYAGGLGVSLLSLGIFLFFYRKNLKQKQMILNLQRELHHRIKNNLRVITAFINSIKEKFENKEKVDVKEVNYQLNELEKRVQTIYNLHKQLYEGSKVTHLDLDKYINLLTQTIASNYDQAVEMELDIPEGTSIKADNSIILGLILTELTINAFKHAFKKAGGRIKIKIRDLGKQLKIVFSDNGPGLPEDLDIKNLDSFGMRIVRNMTKQMDGEIKMINENGLTYEIKIPKI